MCHLQASAAAVSQRPWLLQHRPWGPPGPAHRGADGKEAARGPALGAGSHVASLTHRHTQVPGAEGGRRWILLPGE